jgi:hypothetical protein
MTMETYTIPEQIAMLTEVLLQPMLVFNGMTIVTKLCLLIIIAAGAIALVTAVLRRVSGGRRSGLLTVLSWIAIVFGILGALYGAMNIYIGIQAVGKANLAVVAPGLIEIIYTLVPALIVRLIASIGNAGAKKA